MDLPLFFLAPTKTTLPNTTLAGRGPFQPTLPWEHLPLRTPGPLCLYSDLPTDLANLSPPCPG